MAELLLEAGYAVIFLHRTGSAFPYARRILPPMVSPELWLRDTNTTAAAAARDAAASSFAAHEARFLSVTFTSVAQYLERLREACCAIEPAGARAMLCLAAAVSDFYIPEERLSEHKIQSGASGGGTSGSGGVAGGLTLQLDPVPKMLGAIKHASSAGQGCTAGGGAPKAFVVSFKLETNEAILLAKAAAALSKYGIDVVCANLLQSYKRTVTLVSAANAGVPPSAPSVRGDETAHVPVAGVERTTLSVDEGDASIQVEALLVEELVRLHTDAIDRDRRGETA